MSRDIGRSFAEIMIAPSGVRVTSGRAPRHIERERLELLLRYHRPHRERLERERTERRAAVASGGSA